MIFMSLAIGVLVVFGVLWIYSIAASRLMAHRIMLFIFGAVILAVSAVQLKYFRAYVTNKSFWFMSELWIRFSTIGPAARSFSIPAFCALFPRVRVQKLKPLFIVLFAASLLTFGGLIFYLCVPRGWLNENSVWGTLLRPLAEAAYNYALLGAIVFSCYIALFYRDKDF